MFDRLYQRPHVLVRHQKGPLAEERLRYLLDSKTRITVNDLRAFLRDHDGFPNSVCQHPDPSEPPEDRYATIASIVMDLDARTLEVGDGQPCEASFEEVLVCRIGPSRRD